ncbi:MAG: hypothetical protein JW934_01005 [Anaerolineae bacterium]|nr:hypothetical protein [Anaerolineae bacterium]
MAEKKVPCEVYSRVVGYLRPVQNWNKGKRQEFHERKPYRVASEPEKLPIEEIAQPEGSDKPVGFDKPAD